MNVFKIFCPHCNLKLDIPNEYAGEEVRCPDCNKCFVAKRPVVQNTTLQKSNSTMPPSDLYKPIPDGYNLAMGYVVFLKVFGWISIIVGVVTGIVRVVGMVRAAEVVRAAAAERALRYGYESTTVTIGGGVPTFLDYGLSFIVCVIAGILMALSFFIIAAFLSLFCGMAKNTAYMTVLMERQQENR